jgi:hypothetical protein
VLGSGSQLMRRHPVIPNRSVPGQHVTHTPSFSQQNGHLYVFEYIDLSTTKINKTKERAGWMAYMFDDIKGLNPTAETFSLVRPEKDSGVEQIDYAKTILRGGSKIVNWSDDDERGQFLQEREQIAA